MAVKLWTLRTDGRRYAAEGSSGISAEDVGDPVMLWRTSRGGGAVAIGSIMEETVSVPPSTLRLAGQPESTEERSRAVARPFYTEFCLSNPLSATELHTAGLNVIARAGRGGGSVKAGRKSFSPLELEDEQWAAFLGLIQAGRAADDSPLLWPVEPGTVLYRSEVHDIFGGGRGWAECSSAKTMNDLLFVTPRTDDPELVPSWDGDVLRVAGQATQGHTSVSVTRHLTRGRALRVFEARDDLCQYIGDFVVDQVRPVERRIDVGRRMVKSDWWRRPGQKSGGQLADFSVPLLRIRQLSGIEAFRGPGDPFDGVTPVRLGLTPSVGAVQPAEPADSSEIVGAIRGIIELVERDPAAALSLEGVDAAEALHTLVQRRRREADLNRLRAVVADPQTLEGDLQKLLEGMLWLFGGGFLPTGGRRMLTTTDQLDLSLLRPDGSLHGVEIKKARIERLLKKQRSHFIFGYEVYAALGQAMNYQRSLDEQRAQILAEHRIDTRRSTMSVVIGSAQHAPRFSASDIAETVRTHNASFSRIAIVTYDQLIEEAEGLLSGPGHLGD